MVDPNESDVDPDAAAKAAADAVETDELGRPVLPPAQGYQDALKQGYYGNDGKDLGAAVRPEDVHSFDEAKDRIDQPAHSETPVIENSDLGGAGGYSALGAGNTPAPVEGDATSIDNPSLGVTTPAPTADEAAPGSDS